MFLPGMAGEGAVEGAWAWVRPVAAGAVSSAAGNIATYNTRNTTFIFTCDIIGDRFR